MAQYKVPQDVEADDKLIGPFSFRQFVYLLIAAGLIALAVGLWQIFPLLAIIPLPPVLFFGALALPLRKDQPMETYLAAIVSYYLKPRNRIWAPGQRESTIQITAPKIVETSRTRDITGEEATHRLSFLADIVDTEGYAIKSSESNPMRDDLFAEASAVSDMFEGNRFNTLENKIVKEENERHHDVINNMKKAIEQNENIAKQTGDALIQKHSDLASSHQGKVDDVDSKNIIGKPDLMASPVVVLPSTEPIEQKEEPEEKVPEKPSTTSAKPSIIELANNSDFSVATIAKEAKRIKEREKGEVFISLH